jgi:uncharacterized membrane protein
MLDLAPPSVPRLIDRHFRWRGTAVSRREGFSDAVFAIVLALLFLRAAPPENFHELRAAMKALVPFAATFAIIAYIWVEHWLFSRRYDLQDGWTTLLDMVLLFLLLFYAYPLKFLFTLITVSMFGPIGHLTMQKLLDGLQGEADAQRLFVFYGLGYGLIFGVLALMYWRAHRLRGLLGLDEVERLLTRSGITQCTLQSGVAATSVVLALTYGVAWGLPGWVYCAIGPLMAVHGTREGRRVQRLVAARADTVAPT